MELNQELNRLVAEVGAVVLADDAEATDERSSLEFFFIRTQLSLLADLADGGDQEAAEKFANLVAEIDRAFEEATHEEGGTSAE